MSTPKARQPKNPQLVRRLVVLLAVLIVVAIPLSPSLLDMLGPTEELPRPQRSTPSILSPEYLETAARREQELRASQEHEDRLALRLPALQPTRPVPQPATRPRTPRTVEMPSGLVPSGVPTARPPAEPWAPRSPAARAWRELTSSDASSTILRAGTFIPAQLLTPVTSASAGTRPVMAMVSHDVLGHPRAVVIPVGSRLLGRLVGDVSPGRERAVIAWDRLDLPDGRAFDLGGLEATSADGSAGVPGRVDHHWRSLYAHAFLTSLVGGLAQVSQRSEGTLGASTGEIFASGVGRDLSQVTEDVVDRVLRRPSTLTIPRGQRLAVLVTRDVTFGAP